MVRPRLRFLCLAILLLPLSLAAAPARVPHVAVIGLIGSKAILRIDGHQVMLGRGESQGDVTLLDIGKAEALLNVGGRELRLGMGMDTGGIVAREGGPSVEIVMNGRGQFLTNGMVNGRVVEFLVDTGANTVSMTADDARSLGIDYRLDGQEGRTMTAGGVVRSWNVTLKSVQIGPIAVRNVEASIREAPSFGPILLGMTFLSRVDIQHERNRLRLTAR